MPEETPWEGPEPEEPTISEPRPLGQLPTEQEPVEAQQAQPQFIEPLAVDPQPAQPRPTGERHAPKHLAEPPAGKHFLSRSEKDDTSERTYQSRHMAVGTVSPYTRPAYPQPWQTGTADWPKDLIDEDDEPKRSLAKSLVEWAIVIACAVGVALLVRNFVVEPFTIPSESMLETIQVGDRVLGEKLSYLVRAPEAGDIVTFADPEDPETTLIKRVIATPGQTLDLQDGQVVVDGEPLDEPYAVGQSWPLPTNSATVDEPISYPYTLGADEIWVMGDNRENSLDSRYFGPIELEDVSSRAWLKFWPLSEIGVLS